MNDDELWHCYTTMIKLENLNKKMSIIEATVHFKCDKLASFRQQYTTGMRYKNRHELAVKIKSHDLIDEFLAWKDDLNKAGKRLPYNRDNDAIGSGFVSFCKLKNYDNKTQWAGSWIIKGLNTLQRLDFIKKQKEAEGIIVSEQKEMIFNEVSIKNENKDVWKAPVAPVLTAPSIPTYPSEPTKIPQGMLEISISNDIRVSISHNIDTIKVIKIIELLRSL